MRYSYALLFAEIRYEGPLKELNNFGVPSIKKQLKARQTAKSSSMRHRPTEMVMEIDAGTVGETEFGPVNETVVEIAAETVVETAAETVVETAAETLVEAAAETMV